MAQRATLSFKPTERELVDYLLVRDTGKPDVEAEPLGLEQIFPTVRTRIDILSWAYDPLGKKFPADGFLLELAFDATPPYTQTFLVPASATSWCVPMDVGISLTYSIAAWRSTRLGLEATPLRTIGEWTVQGNDLGDDGINNMLFEIPLVGEKNAENTTFTVPYSIRLDSNGLPMAQLIWRRAVQMYSTDNPPPPGRWHLEAESIILGEPPESGDYLAFAFIILA